MSKNNNLHKAKTAKNDKFYTQMIDIEKELQHYKEHFKDKIIYCNCDDPKQSHFWKYFHLNFAELGLKKLISTHYDKEESTYKMEYTGGNDNDIEVGVKTSLEGNGDFRNQECLDLLDEADIVVTNPPFSLFREYMTVLMEHKKNFLIIGNKNAITYKEFFPLLKDDEVWIGYNSPSEFSTPDGITKKLNGLTRWFTNLDIIKRHEFIDLIEKYTPEKYPKYDNYDAINVDKVSEIPVDYDGVIGVPITFMDKYNPDQFEIVGFCDTDSPLSLDKNYNEYIGYKQDRTLYGRTGSTFGKCPVLVMDDKKHPYYEKNGIRVQATYHRVFIRKKAGM